MILLYCCIFLYYYTVTLVERIIARLAHLGTLLSIKYTSSDTRDSFLDSSTQWNSVICIVFLLLALDYVMNAISFYLVDMVNKKEKA